MAIGSSSSGISGPFLNSLAGLGMAKIITMKYMTVRRPQAEAMIVLAGWNLTLSTNHPPRMGAIMFPKARHMLNNAAALSLTAANWVGEVYRPSSWRSATTSLPTNSIKVLRETTCTADVPIPRKDNPISMIHSFPGNGLPGPVK